MIFEHISGFLEIFVLWDKATEFGHLGSTRKIEILEDFREFLGF
jgi:hypothetical protein